MKASNNDRAFTSLSSGSLASIRRASSVIPRKVMDEEGPTVLLCANGTARLWQSVINDVRSRWHFVAVCASRRKPSSPWTIAVTPSSFKAAHSNAVENRSKMAGELRQPIGRTASITYWPFHWKPSKGLSAGETGIIRNADSISTFAMCTGYREPCMNEIASWILAYVTDDISSGIKSLTDSPSGYDKRCIIRNSPLAFFGTTPKGETRNFAIAGGIVYGPSILPMTSSLDNFLSITPENSSADLRFPTWVLSRGGTPKQPIWNPYVKPCIRYACL